MTHEGFKAIMTWWDYRDDQLIVDFLDGENNDSLLLKWFNLWKVGKQKLIFEEIEQLNETERQSRQNTNSIDIPTDSTIPRDIQNRNADRFKKIGKLRT